MDYGLSLAQTFQPELLRDEKVAWAAQPDPRFRLSGQDVFLVPFTLLWGGFAIFWELGVLGVLDGQPSFNAGALFGLPFVIIGQYVIWGRFLYKRYRQRRTFYAVTNRRVLIVALARSRQLQSLFLNQLPTVTKTVRRDGSGSLVFGTAPYWAGSYANSGMDFFNTRGGAMPPAFYDIPDVDGVYQLIMRQKGGLDQIA